MYLVFLCCPTFAIVDTARDSRYLIDMDAQQHVELVRGASHEVVAAAEVNNPGRLGGISLLLEIWDNLRHAVRFGMVVF